MGKFLVFSARMEPNGARVARFYADENGVVTANLHHYDCGDNSSADLSHPYKTDIELKDLYGRRMTIPYKILIIKLISPYTEDQNKTFLSFTRVCERRLKRALAGRN